MKRSKRINSVRKADTNISEEKEEKLVVSYAERIAKLLEEYPTIGDYLKKVHEVHYLENTSSFSKSVE